MKCVCGYVYIDHVGDKIGDEPFIDVCLSYDVKYKVYKGMGEYDEVKLKACPKCGIVKIAHKFD